MPPVAEGCTGRSLCNSIKKLTEQRLAFDQKLRARAAAPMAPSPTRAGTLRAPADEADVEEILPAGVLPVEGRLTYMKLQGDQLLHAAEIARVDGLSTPECEGLAAEALEAYLAAQRAALQGDNNHNNSGSGVGSDLPVFHPLRLELALRISSVLLHMLGRPIDAWDAAYPVYLVAAERPARLGPRGLAITQLLRDHLALIDVRIEQEDSIHINASTPGACRLNEGADAWSFLRVPGGLDDKAVGTTAGDKLRALALVTRARASTAGVAKVLLGTMSKADLVLSALKQIFAVFVRKHAVPVNKCEDDKHVWLLGRKVTLKFFLNHGPFLSWSGFETACNKFKIAAASATAFPQLNEVVQMPELSDRRPVSHGSSPTTLAGDIDWTPRDGYLLSAAQARIAFVSACTPGPVVASFPEGSSKAAARATDGGPENETSSCEQEDAYWRDIERVVLSRSTPEATGLSFHQFVDALARCGLMCSLGVGKTEQSGPGIRTGAGVKGRPEYIGSAAERVQAILTKQMNLLDSQLLKATLRAHEEEQIESGHGHALATGQGFHATATAKKTTGKDGKSDGTMKPQKGRIAQARLKQPQAEQRHPTLTPIRARGSTVGKYE